MMVEDVTVSVCIPTFNRPDMLLHCVRSVFEQTMVPQEIVIGDDSTDDRTEKLIRSLSVPSQISLNYRRNPPKADRGRNLSAAENINSVFTRARSSWLYLIHDDDWLLPNAIEYGTSPICAGEAVDVIYGNHLVADADGIIDTYLSAGANTAFARTADLAGLQPSALWSSIRQQMPTSYMVRASVVKDIGYLCEGQEDCEFGFGVKAAIGGAKFFFVDKAMYVYRLSAESNGRGQNAHLDSSAIDGAYTIWRNRHSISRIADEDLRRHIRAIIYRAAVSCGLRKCRRLEALSWALHPRFGVRWWGQEGLGVVSAICCPELSEGLKRVGRHGWGYRGPKTRRRKEA